MKKRITQLNMSFKAILLLGLVFISSFTGHAGVETFSERLEGAQISNGATLVTFDDKYLEYLSNPAWANDFTNYKVVNRVRLGLNPEMKHLVDASMTLDLQILGTKTDGTQITYNKTLFAEYLTNEHLNIQDLNTFVFEDCHKVEVLVNNVTTNEVRYFYLQSEIEIERYYTFSHLSVPNSGVNVISANGDYLEVYWEHVYGAEEYELEYVHINDYTDIENVFKPIGDLDFNFYLNSSRVTLASNLHRIPKTFDHGYFIYRVRAIGRHPLDYSKRLIGEWNDVESGVISDLSTAHVLPIGSEFDPLKNWGYQVGIAEDGKRFEGVSYVDGLGRPRQSITHNTETEQVIVSNSYYDSHGRPVISTLPVPEESQDLEYRNNFNLYEEDNGGVITIKPLTGQEYDKINNSLDGCSPTFIPLSTTSGAGEYYSSANPNQDGENAAIPDAKKFPYSRVEYMPDQTGRVKRVGAFGEEFQIGTGHETVFFYSTPSQEELIRLFGSEVGLNHQYQKRLMRDANGQYYVEYYDLAGRVIASGMLGKTPDNLTALDNNVPTTLVQTIVGEDFYDLSTTPNTVVFSKPETITDEDDYHFNFHMTPEDFQSTCMDPEICFDCVYDVSLTVVDAECTGEIMYEKTISVDGEALNDICDGVSSVDDLVTLHLPEGTYQFERTISINEDAKDTYWCMYFDQATCVDTYSDVYNELYTTANFGACNDDLTFTLPNNGNGPQECNIMLETFVNDMIPGGQYGLYDYDISNNTYSVSDPLSILNTSASSLLGANWKTAAQAYPYMDDATTVAYVQVNENNGIYTPAVDDINLLLPGNTPGTFKTTPDNLTNLSDFILSFRPYWGLSLAPYHPEYCYYTFCQDNIEFHQYTLDLSEVIEYDEACPNEMVNPLDMTPYGPNVSGNLMTTTTTAFYCTNLPATTSMQDDFFLNGLPGSSYATDFENELINYYQIPGTQQYVDIWSMAIATVSGQTFTNAAELRILLDLYVKDPCYSDDAIWLTFRGMYQSLREKYFKLAELDYAMTNGCYSGCIGNNQFTNSSIVGETPNTFGSYTTTPGVTIQGSGPCANPSAYDSKHPRVLDQITQMTLAYNTYSNSTAAQTQAQVEADMIAGCEDYCELTADTWIQNLSFCDLSVIDTAALRNDLVDFCKLGCSPTTLAGLSTAVPDLILPNGNSYGSMEEIVNHYIGTPTGMCNYYLLQDVPPAHDDPSELELPVLDECGCDMLSNTRTEFLALETAGNLPVDVTNIEEYFYTQNGVWFDDLDELLCKCDSYSAASLPQIVNEQIHVAPILTCITDNCTDCSTVEAIQQAVVNYFPNEVITSSSNYGTILMNWANQELGFSLSASAYNEFLLNCQGTSVNPVCEITPQALDFKEMLDVIIRRGQLLTSNVNAVDLSTQNIVFANSDMETILGGSDFWSCDPAVCDDNNISLSFGDIINPCVVDLTIPSNSEFTFGDIVGIQTIEAINTECGVLGNFQLIVDYYSCGVRQSGLVYGSTSCFDISKCYCGGASELCDDPYQSYQDGVAPCYGSVLAQISQLADEEYDDRVLEARNQFEDEYDAECKKAFNNSSWTYGEGLRSYQFTLFYYDQAGNLVRTVAPEGIDFLAQPDIDNALTAIQNTDFNNSSTSATVLPTHNFQTVYEYNSYNQLVSTTNPDQEGDSEFWYDRYGRIVASQNPVQKDLNKFSYTYYDPQGRPFHVGQVETTTPLDELITKADDLGTSFETWVSNGVQSEMTVTFYDEPIAPTFEALFANGKQENLRLRVASVLYYPVEGPLDSYESAVHYSYDVHGNVIESIQDVPMMAPVAQQFKSTQYEFELISGNVSKVEFQKDEIDQMTHEYVYDELNRLTEVYSSTDGIHSSREAAYQYYDYGPLARVELGEYNVQGTDYAYTINGWLKGVNSNTLNASKDIGLDGEAGFHNDNTRVHTNFANDVVGYSLGYFDGDYNPIGGNSFEADYSGSNFNSAAPNLYNGNIRHYVNAIGNLKIQGTAYTYDQLQRFKSANVYNPGSNIGTNHNWTNDSHTLAYQTEIDYDRNGNILHLKRNGPNTHFNMDNFTYEYGLIGGELSNRLDFVSDSGVDYQTLLGINDFGDIKSGINQNGIVTPGDIQSSSNYQYNKIGELTSDASELISNIEWRTGDHKMKSMTRGGASQTQLEFIYNPFGVRVAKIEKTSKDGTLFSVDDQKVTFYAYDANGQVMGVYDSKYYTIAGETTLSEQYLYGSGRLGVKEANKIVYNSGVITEDNTDGLYENSLGQKMFELTNHTGNVLALVTDRVTYTNADGYDAVIKMEQDYYSFGMRMPGRSNTYGNSDVDYRYAFQGMEQDNEVSGNGNSYTTEFRQYDPRLGRWKSLDPLMHMFPSMSPYCGFDNNPIYYTDIYGLSSDGPGDPPKKMDGERSFDDKNADANEMVLLPDTPTEGQTVSFEYTNGDGSTTTSTWTYAGNNDGGRWEKGVTKSNGGSWGEGQYVSVSEVDNVKLIAKTVPPSVETNSDGLDINGKDGKNQAGDVKKEDTGIDNKITVNTGDSDAGGNIDDDTDDEIIPDPPGPVTSYAKFQFRDDWFPAGKNRNTAYHDLQIIADYLIINPTQVFYVDIFTTVPRSFDIDDTKVGSGTQYSGKLVTNLSWNRFLTVRTILRRKTKNDNIIIKYVPHYIYEGTQKFRVRAAP